MNERSPTAYRAAVLLTILAAACNDGPLAPRHEPSSAARTTPSEAGVQVFSGRVADSVVHAFDAVWARGSYADHREARRAWRRANGIPDSVGDPGLTPIAIVPNALLGIDDGSYRPPPQVLSHYESLYFGHTDLYTNVPDGVEAAATFVGDQAEIAIPSLTITKKDGSSSSFHGTITKGTGAITNCADVTLGNCSNQRLLNGVMTLGSAPTCDASGSGSVSYSVSNLTSTTGITSGAGSGTASASATGSLSGTSAPCPPPQTSDPTTTQPSDGGTPPPPPPPIPPYDPAPPLGGGTGIYFNCEQADLYQNGVLIESILTCYPDT